METYIQGHSSNLKGNLPIVLSLLPGETGEEKWMMAMDERESFTSLSPKQVL